MDASIGFVTQTGMDIPEAVRRAAKYSFNHVEILMEGNADHSRINTDAINHAASTHDLDIHVHLPFQLDIASPKQYVRDGSVREVIAAIETASTIGAGKAILHAGTRAWLDAWDPEDVKSHLLSSIQRLTQIANDHGIELCVENLPSGFYTLRDDFPTLLKQTDASVCLDTGHALREGWSETGVGEYIADTMNQVTHIHVSDPREDGAVHLPIGAGSTEFSDIFTPLLETNWSGTVSVEVFTYNFEYLQASRDHIASILNKGAP
jgi:sugar phosphate isomerase/epimerase